MCFTTLPSINFRPTAFLSGAPGPWAGHLPFAYDLVAAIKPKLIVELGSYYGDSYFGLCQAISENDVPCICYAIDTWKGDPQGGFYEDMVYEAVRAYNERTYSSFSYLLRCTFDEALQQFSDESIDLLHIDGFHTYEAVRHDFESWYPKVRPGGIILLHDVAIRSGDFGVWKFWEELTKKHQHFTFLNSNGLGVLQKPGSTNQNAFLSSLFAGLESRQQQIRQYYNFCAERLRLDFIAGTQGAIDARHSRLQVFYSRSENYREEDSITQIVESDKWLDITLPLPLGLGRRPLRIDPSTSVSIIDIESLRLRDSDAQVVWELDLSRGSEMLQVNGTAYLMPSFESFRILSHGVDPQIFLPGLPNIRPNQPLTLELRMRIDQKFTAVQEVLRRIENMDRQQEVLKQSKESEAAAITEREQDLKQRYMDVEQRLNEIQRMQLEVISDREQVYLQNSQLMKDLVAMRQLLDDSKEKLEQMDRIMAAYSAEKERRQMLESSLSWRITGPLRRGAEIVRFGLKRFKRYPA